MSFWSKFRRKKEEPVEEIEEREEIKKEEPVHIKSFLEKYGKWIENPDLKEYISCQPDYVWSFLEKYGKYLNPVYFLNGVDKKDEVYVLAKGTKEEILDHFKKNYSDLSSKQVIEAANSLRVWYIIKEASKESKLLGNTLELFPILELYS